MSFQFNEVLVSAKLTSYAYDLARRSSRSSTGFFHARPTTWSRMITEHAFRRSRSLPLRIMDSVHGKGRLVFVAFFVPERGVLASSPDRLEAAGEVDGQD